MDSPHSSPTEAQTLSAPPAPDEDAIGNETQAEPELVQQSAAVVASCPRCGSRLISPESLGWCPKCRYCRTLEEDVAKSPLVKPLVKTSPLGIVEFWEMLNKLPSWLWVLLGGCGTVAMVSLAADFLLPPYCLTRALWSTIQFAIGLVGLVVGQIWLVVLFAPTDDKVSFKDVLFPGRLWSLAFRGLPERQHQVWLGGWSVTLSVCAVLVVGGYSYWYQFYKPKKLAEQNLLKMVKEMAEGAAKDRTLGESLEDFANTQDLTKEDKKDPPKVEPKRDDRPTVQCVIIGYTLGEEKQITGLVLASDRYSQLRYVGVVKDGLARWMDQELLERLRPIRRDKPFIKGLNIQAIWVEPKVYCEVHQSGWNDDNHLIKPSFSTLLTEK
jgi:hypothetical protein